MDTKTHLFDKMVELNSHNICDQQRGMDHTLCVLQHLEDWVFITNEPMNDKRSHLIAQARMYFTRKNYPEGVVLIKKIFYNQH